MNMKRDHLRAAATQIDLKGRSKLDKAGLEEAVMATPDGRKALYGCHDAEWAAAVLKIVLQVGSYCLRMEDCVPVDRQVEGTFTSFKALSVAKFGTANIQHRIEACFKGRVRALKQLIRAQGLREIRWTDGDKQFMLGKQAKKAA